MARMTPQHSLGSIECLQLKQKWLKQSRHICFTEQHVQRGADPRQVNSEVQHHLQTPRFFLSWVAPLRVHHGHQCCSSSIPSRQPPEAKKSEENLPRTPQPHLISPHVSLARSVSHAFLCLSQSVGKGMRILESVVTNQDSFSKSRKGHNHS